MPALSAAMRAATQKTSESYMPDEAEVFNGLKSQDQYGSITNKPPEDAVADEMPCRIQYIDRIPAISFEGRSDIIVGNFFIRLPKFKPDGVTPTHVTQKSVIRVNKGDYYAVQNVYNDEIEQPNFLCYCLRIK